MNIYVDVATTSNNSINIRIKMQNEQANKQREHDFTRRKSKKCELF